MRLFNLRHHSPIAAAALVMVALTPIIASAGSNAGAIAQLSWSPDSLVLDLPSAPTIPFRAYVQLQGLNSVTALAVRFTWYPSGVDSGFDVLSDTTGAPSCARVEHTPSTGPFQSDSSYEWTMRLAGAPPPSCLSYLLQPPAGAISVRGRFCLAEAHALDSNEAVDDVLAINSVTVAGGLGCASCPPTLYTATPGVASPTASTLSTPAMHARRVLAAGAGYTDPFVTLVGNSLNAIVSVSAIDESGVAAEGSIIGSQGFNLTSVGFPSLTGSGPWNLVAASTGGVGDTLRGAPSNAGILRTRFRPLIEFGSGWKLPNRAVEAWSPNGRYLALHREDGVYAFDPSRPADAPVRIFAQGAAYHAWSPDGQWMVCRVQSDEERHKDLFSLIAVPVDSGGPVTVISKADVGPFVWGSDGRIHFWQVHGDARRDVEPPTAWRTRNAHPQTPRTHLVWVPVKASPAGGVIRRYSPELQEEVSPSGFNRPGVSLVVPEGTFPDGQRFLVSIHERDRSPHTAIVDREGRVLRELGSHAGADAFTGTSVSPDGRYVIGFRETDSGDDIASAPLYVADAAGSWLIPVEGGISGLWPRFSPSSYLVAFQDPTTGHVHVGTLEILAR